MPRLARLAALAAVSLSLATPASAQEIVVTTTVDEFGENTDDCGLREAVQAANTGADFGGCVWPGAIPTIRLDAERYRFFRPGDLEENNETGDADIRVPLVIAGSQMGETTINGRFDDRVLDIHGVDVTIQDVRIRHGRTHRDAGGLNGEHGGGIRAENATLTLIDVVFLENRAGDGDKGSPGGDGGHGGALYATSSSITMTDVLVRENHAGDGGREEDNDGSDTISGAGGHGGAFYIIGSLTVTDGIVRDNRAGDGGDAGMDGGSSSGGDGGDGGAIWVQGPVSLTDVQFDGNRAGDGADETAGSSEGGNGGGGGDGGTLYVRGDVALTDVEILNSRTGVGGDGYDDSSGSSFSGASGEGGAIWAQGGAFAFTRGLLQHNTTSSSGMGQSAGSGGGLHLQLTGVASLTEVRIENNRTADGSDERWDEEGAGHGGTGGGGLIRASTLRILSSSVLDNATGSGGGAEGFAGQGGAGGGLYFTGDSLVVRHSTFARNTTGNGGTADDFAEGGRGGDGGGLYASVGAEPMEVIVIESSTFSGNATGAGGAGDFEDDGRGGHGGAISAYGPLEIRHSTIVSNSVARLDADAPPTLGGGLYSNTSITIENSIVVGNLNDGAPDDCSGTATGSFLLSSDDTGCPMDGPGALAVAPGDVFVTVLEPLQDTGGLTLTHALLPSSPAIDAGSCPLESTDQHGLPRPVDDPNTTDAGNGCDIGAVETQEGFAVRADDAPVATDGLALGLSIAPNPSRGATTVRLAGVPGERVTVEVLDVRGRQIRLLHEGVVSPEGLALEIGALPAGVYLVRAVSPTAIASARFTVLR